MPNADGSIIIRTNIDTSEADKELRNLTQEIEKVEKDISSREATKSPLVKQAEELQVRINEAKKEVQDYKDAWLSGVSGADTKEMDAVQKVQQLQAEQDKVIEKIDKIDAKLLPAYEKLDGMKAKAGELAQRMASAAPAASAVKTSVIGVGAEAGKTEKNVNGMGLALNRASKKAGAFAMRLKSVIRGALVFTVITKALSSFRDWVGKTLKTNDESAAAIARLKGALLTLAQPLQEVIIPAFTKFVDILARVTARIAAVVSSMFGKTIDQSAEAAKNLYDEKKALDGVNKAAKQASGSIDEMNVISGDSSSGGSTNSAIAPDFTSLISGAVDPIIEFFAGTAMLALGAILTFSGAHILLGIGLMAAGAALIYDSASGDWEAVKNALEGPIGMVFTLVSGASLVLGAILAFSGANIPLGIGLMLLGAAGLATAISANWRAIEDALQGPIGAVAAIVSVALLVLGAILVFSGAGVALGLGMLLVGAAGLAATVKANWDYIVSALQGPVGAVVAIISAVLLVLGVILLFTGAGIPLGLGLIVAGAAGLAAAIAPNWDFILDKLKGAWNSIKKWWNTKIAPALNAVKEFFVGIFNGIWNEIRTVINTILGGIEGMANGVIKGINFAISAINKLSFDVPDWVPAIGGKSVGFNLKTLNEVKIPRLAQGAVIPPNREFMAVLGDQKSGRNIEAPESLLRQIMGEEFGESMGELLDRVEELIGAVRGIKLSPVMVADGRIMAEAVERANRANGYQIVR